MSPVVLGVDTSTVVCAGVALDDRVAVSAAVEDRRAHAEQLTPLIARVLAEAAVTTGDLGGIVVGVGPGPFTGLRVGVATAAVLAETLGIPIRGVCSLDGVALEWALGAAGSAPTSEFAVVADARRHEVYWARYNASGVRLDGPFVTGPEGVPDLPLAGPGAHLVGRSPAGPTALDAGLLAAHGRRLPDAGLEPLYLRRPDAHVPTTRKSTLLQPRLAMMRTR